MDDGSRVKAAVDIAEVVGRYVPLKKKGSRLEGLCPFHAEKTPSFGVNPVGQYFKCFGCGKGGDVFTFLTEHLRIEFREALQMLADEAGIQLTERSPGSRKRRDQRERVMASLAEAARIYRDELTGSRGQGAREFLRRRGIGEAIEEEFGLGFAPARGLQLGERLRQEGHREEDLEEAGLVRRKDGRLRDAFWDRVLIPIRDHRGRTVAFGGRRLIDGEGAPEPKYINSKEGLVFHKGQVLYGMDRAREPILKADRVVLMEGYTDVILAHQAGLRTTVAALGTAITAEHAKELRRLAEQAILFLDGDTAGERAATRAVPILMGANLSLLVVPLEEGKDPGDFFSEGNDVEAFERLVRGKGQSGVQFLVEVFGGRRAVDSEARAEVAHRCLDVLSTMDDPLRRDAALQQVSRELDLPDQWVRSLPRRKPAFRRSREPAEPEGMIEVDLQEEEVLVAPRTAQDVAEQDLLLALYKKPELRGVARELVPEGSVRNPINQRILALLMDHPDGELHELLDQTTDDGRIQSILSGLEEEVLEVEAGKLLDGAIQYFEHASREQRGRDLKESFRERERQAETEPEGASEAALDFLKKYQEWAQRRRDRTD